MRRGRLRLSILLVVISCALLSLAGASDQTTLPARDPVVAQMVSAVSTDRLAETIAALTGLGTRFTTRPGCRVAGTSIYNFLSRLGLAVEYDAFDYAVPNLPVVGSGRNVLGAQRGTVTPERVIVIGAHYDSMGTDRNGVAPGADDNASGVAVMLELARILSRHRFGCTIEFVGYDAEEMGLKGSAHVAARFKKKRDEVVAAFNLDMVGFSDHGTRGLALVSDRRNQWLADRFEQAATTYDVPLKIVKRPGAIWARSDQMSFWSAGYPALSISEDEPDRNPHYHRSTDTVDTLDMTFLSAVAAGTLAALADLAQVTDQGASAPLTLSAAASTRRSTTASAGSCRLAR